MNPLFSMKAERFFELRHLIARNVFLLINAIIFSVVALLIFFGSIKEGILLGIIVVINIILGLTQDIHAWLTLEHLRLLAKPFVSRLKSDGTAAQVFVEDLKKNDRVILRLGDQVPSDSTVISGKGFEVTEALITGESIPFSKKEGELVLAGSIVTSGTATLQINTVFSESRIAKMTEKIQRYTENASPIQRSVQRVVKYSGYVLLLVISFVVVRAIETSAPKLITIRSIGALSSMIIPQGLVIAVTLLFSYGAVHFLRRHILLQDVNATEKMGRIKNLCFDKTGTLTENRLTVKEMHVPSGISHEEAEYLTLTYICESGDSSQTILAVHKNLTCAAGGKALDTMAFSSERRYGWILLSSAKGKESILAGPPDVFLPHLSTQQEKDWLSLLVDTHGRKGKRLMCIVRTYKEMDPRHLIGNDLSVVAVFILHNDLRSGIREAIDFFQKRGVVIRIISGDDAETVRAISDIAGIKNTSAFITGEEMEQWGDLDFDELASRFSVFARIKPEQKAKIIKALKKDGFTAMVGDGANDALAIKIADLGISMFDGAPATRQLASVVLMNNSFAEFPAAVTLADNIIKNVEIFSSIFFNQTFIGVFFFAFLSAYGFFYPFTPLNITFSNYFTVGLPGFLIFYWAIRPSQEAAKENARSFLRRVVPFPFIAAILQSLAMMVIFLFFYHDLDGTTEIRAIMVASSILLGIGFFSLAPFIYEGNTSRRQNMQIFGFVLFELLLLFMAFSNPVFTNFFNITAVPLKDFSVIFFVSAFCALVLWGIARIFSKHKELSQ